MWLGFFFRSENPRSFDLHNGALTFLAWTLLISSTMTAWRSRLGPLALVAIFICLGQVDGFAAAYGEDTTVLDRVVYVLLAVAIAVAVVFIFYGNVLMRFLGRLGISSGDERGPKPGEGAVIHDSSGEADFDGSSGRIPPRDAQRDFTSPPRKSTD